MPIVVDTFVGALTLVVAPDGRVDEIRFGADDADGDRDGLEPDATIRVSRPVQELVAALHDYCDGKAPVFDPGCLRLERCTDFQREVYEAARAIPLGETRTYGELAAAIGRPKAARAVGSALGANPFPILIPCHRILATGGKLGGFSGGLHIKQKLLEFEENFNNSQ